MRLFPVLYTGFSLVLAEPPLKKKKGLFGESIRVDHQQAGKTVRVNLLNGKVIELPRLVIDDPFRNSDDDTDPQTFV